MNDCPKCAPFEDKTATMPPTPDLELIQDGASMLSMGKLERYKCKGCQAIWQRFIGRSVSRVWERVS